MEILHGLIEDQPDTLKKREIARTGGPCFICNQIFKKILVHLRESHGLNRISLLEYQNIYKADLDFITQGGEMSFDGNVSQAKDWKWRSKLSDYAHGVQNENMKCATCGEDIPARLFKAHCMRHDIGEMILCKDCNRYFGRAQMAVHLKSAHGGLA